jgi:hypothetical protein
LDIGFAKRCQEKKHHSEVLRQPATSTDTLIGDGFFLLPPLTGSEMTTGQIMFLRY